jgi:hypothetical protein
MLQLTIKLRLALVNAIGGGGPPLPFGPSPKYKSLQRLGIQKSNAALGITHSVIGEYVDIVCEAIDNVVVQPILAGNPIPTIWLHHNREPQSLLDQFQLVEIDDQDSGVTKMTDDSKCGSVNTDNEMNDDLQGVRGNTDYEMSDNLQGGEDNTSDEESSDLQGGEDNTSDEESSDSQGEEDDTSDGESSDSEGNENDTDDE